MNWSKQLAMCSIEKLTSQPSDQPKQIEDIWAALFIKPPCKKERLSLCWLHNLLDRQGMHSARSNVQQLKAIWGKGFKNARSVVFNWPVSSMPTLAASLTAFAVGWSFLRLVHSSETANRVNSPKMFENRENPYLFVSDLWNRPQSL